MLQVLQPVRYRALQEVLQTQPEALPDQSAAQQAMLQTAHVVLQATLLTPLAVQQVQQVAR